MPNSNQAVKAGFIKVQELYRSGWRISETQEPQCLCLTPLNLCSFGMATVAPFPVSHGHTSARSILWWWALPLDSKRCRRCRALIYCSQGGGLQGDGCYGGIACAALPLFEIHA